MKVKPIYKARTIKEINKVLKITFCKETLAIKKLNNSIAIKPIINPTRLFLKSFIFVEKIKNAGTIAKVKINASSI